MSYARTIAWPRRPPVIATVGACLVTLLGTPLAGQENRWSGQTELGASVFFGNTEQTLVTTRGGIERADSTLEMSASLKFTYGEASDADGNDFVSKRSWQVVAGGGYRPFARVTPFFFGTLESSFESKIDQRATGGAGAKVVFVRNDVSRVDVSLAMLAERTVPLSAAESPVESTTLARWSMRFRYRREWDEGRIGFNSIAFYRPALQELANFTMESELSFSVELTDRTDVRLSFLDRYDSGADDRGARTNNDGQLILSLVTTF